MLNLSVPDHLHGADLDKALWEQRQDLIAYASLYSLNLAGIALVGMLMATDAQRACLARMSPEEAREGRRRALIVAAVFLASIPVALLNPSVAPLLWLVLFFDSVGRRVGNRRVT